MQPFGKKINGNISHIFVRQRGLVELLRVLNILKSTRVKELPKASPLGPLTRAMFWTRLEALIPPA